MRESLSHHALKGVMWSAVERFSVQGIQFVLSVILARLVLPSEYGLIAMLGIFLAIAQTFVDSGFSNALIQKKDRTEVDYSTVFYFNIGISILVYGILYMAAPAIGQFYEESLLETICRWVGLSLILNSFTLVQRTRLIIASDFKTLAKASLISVILSGALGVYSAWLGYGVWALVAQSLSNSLLNMILLWCLVAWVPKKVFSLYSFRRLFSFGSKLLVGALLHTIYLNLYTLVIGRFFNSTQVGYFNRSQTFAVFPSSNLTEIVNRAMYPALCDRQGDEEALIQTFFKYLRATTFLVFPLMIGLAVLSEPLIEVLLTNKWSSSAPLLSILCVAYMWYPVMVFNWQLLNVKGRSDLSLRAEILKKIAAFLILFLSIAWGMEAICWGLLLYSISDMIIIFFFVRKIYSFNLTQEFVTLFPILMCALLMGCSVYVASSFIAGSLLNLIFGILVGILSYSIFGILFKLEEFDLVKQIIKRT